MQRQSCLLCRTPLAEEQAETASDSFTGSTMSSARKEKTIFILKEDLENSISTTRVWKRRKKKRKKRKKRETKRKKMRKKKRKKKRKKRNMKENYGCLKPLANGHA